jgi:hypothetical protein
MMLVLRICRLTVFGVALSGTLSGCGSGSKLDTIPVGGVVTLDGQPVKNARVRFVPDSPDKGRPATGDTDANGAFKLSTVQSGDGIIPGAYKVDLSSLETVTTEAKDKGQLEAASEIPAKYHDTKTSGISFTIGNGDSGKTLEIKLTK